MPNRNAGEFMAQEVQLNVGIPRDLKLRAMVGAEVHNPPMTLKVLVQEALEAYLRPMDDELDEFYSIGAGVVARNRRQVENTTLKQEGQR